MRMHAAVLALAFGLMAGSAEASAIPIVSGSGILLGAAGVTVGPAIYDVTFLDGTCTAVFSGCDSVADFQFQTETSAIAAAQALLDQVFLDFSAVLQFDSAQGSTFGCPFPNGCLALVPYSAPDGLGFLSTAYAFNFTPGNDFVDIFTINQIADTTQQSDFVWAVFTPVSVPEPATLTLLGLGTLGLGFYRSRRRG